jgi:site-specific DNA-methyltransferase (cytosine-N4-specific)
MTIHLLRGDCRQVLKTLPDASVHCCVTSPPYYGLRSYLPVDHPDKHLEIGSEPTLQAWVQTMVEVFRDVRRVLRDDGTLFLNLGDAYAANRSYQVPSTKGGPKHSDSQAAGGRGSETPAGLKPKDLMGQPWRVAFALQDDGWWWRDTIVWHKLNPMPSSVSDRCTPAWEPVLMMSKSAHYFFDAEAIKEPAKVWTGRAATFDHSGNPVAEHIIPGQGAAQHRARHVKPAGWATGIGAHTPVAHQTAQRHRKANGDAAERYEAQPMANKRNVFSLASEPFRDAHFATYPAELIRPFILAGCPEGGTVLDPFGGSGTTGLEADRQHKNAVLIDLDERNIPMSRRRILGDSSLFAEVES